MGTLSRQSLDSLDGADRSGTPDEHTGKWWQDFEKNLAFFKEKGHWDTKHEWVRSVARQLKEVQAKGQLSSHVDGILTSRRVSALRNAGFPMDGMVGTTGSHGGRGGLLTRVMDALGRGETPTPMDVRLIRNSWNSGRLSEKSAAELRAAGMRL